MMSESSTTAAANRSARPGKRFLRLIALVTGTLLLLVCLVLAAGLLWLNTAHARDFLISFAAEQLNTDERELVITDASGSLLGTLELGRLVYRDPAVDLALNRLRLQWSPSQLLSRKLFLSALEVSSVALELKPTEASPQAEPTAGVPDSLALPIDFELSQFALPSLTVKTADSTEPLRFSDIAFAARYGPAERGKQYRLTGVKATTPWGQLQELAVALGDTAPFPLDAQAQWQGSVAQQTLDVDLAGNGSLEALEVSVTALAGSGTAKLIAQAQPLNPVPWKTVDVSLESIDVREFDQTAPRTKLDAQIELTNLEASAPDPDPEVRAQRERIRASLALTNQVPGPFGEERLPLRQASMAIVAAFRDNPAQGTVDIHDIDIGLSAQPAASASGISGRVMIDLADPIQIADQTLPAITSELSFQDIDANQWVSTMPPTALGGTLALSRRQLNIQLAQSETIPFNAPAGLNLPSREATEQPSLQVRASAESDELLIEQMRAAFNGAVVEVNGQAALSKPFNVSFDGKLQNVALEKWLKPEQQAVSKLTSGRLNAAFSVSGPTLAPASTNVKLQIFDSALGGEALATDLNALVSVNEAGSLSRVSAVQAKLSLGTNELTANGALGGPDDALMLSGKLPTLAQFDDRLAGGLNLEATFTGPFTALRTRLRASGSRLSVEQPASLLSLRGLELNADLPITTKPGPQEKLFLKLNANRFKTGDTSIRRARLNLDGTPDEHAYDASVSSGQWAGRIKGKGQALLNDKPSWTTTINRLDVDGKIKAQLRGRPTLTVNADRIDLQKLQLRSSAGQIAIEKARVVLGETADVSVNANIRDLVVSDLIAAVSSTEVPAELGRLRAQADVALAGSGVNNLSGRITLDLDEDAKRNTPKLGIKPGRVLNLTANNGNLTGDLALDLPSLGFSQAYTGEDLKLDGAISLRGDIGGTTAEPTWIARLKGSEIAVLQRSVGWRLDRGVLNATVSPKQVQLNEFKIASGDGTLAISGAADIPAGASDNSRNARQQTLFNGQFVIEPDRFVVPIGPGQRIALSGKTTLKGTTSGIDLLGNLVIDEGVIEVQGSGAPSAPSDLVFVDEQAQKIQTPDAKAGNAEGNAPAIRADLSIDTGQNLRVVGSGIRARLVGKVKLGGVLPAEPRLTGRVDVNDGSYRAYGQALDIKRGIVRFNGPADNPNLDILAIRPNLPVEVGVSVNGTAAVPTIELVSTPELPDAEKLSWLVLGTELDSASGAAQSLALQQAAKSLVGVDNSDEQGGIAERLGFDSLGLGYASDTGPQQGVTDSGGPKGLPGSTTNSGSVSAEEVVTVGRQLSSKVRISYEQGLRGVQNLLRIQYDVSKRLAVRAQTGSDNAIDLLYFFSFD